MIKLFKILSEIKIINKLNIPADIISIEYDEDEEFEVIDEKKVKDIIKKNFSYFSNFKWKNYIKPKMIKLYVEGMNDEWMDEYKNITIRQLLEDFKLFIEDMVKY